MFMSNLDLIASLCLPELPLPDKERGLWPGARGTPGSGSLPGGQTPSRTVMADH